MKKFYILSFLVCSVALCAYGITDDLNAKRRSESFSEKENVQDPSEQSPNKVDVLEDKNENNSSSFWPDAGGSSKPDIKEVDSKKGTKKDKRPNRSHR